MMMIGLIDAGILVEMLALILMAVAVMVVVVIITDHGLDRVPTTRTPRLFAGLPLPHVHLLAVPGLHVQAKQRHRRQC